MKRNFLYCFFLAVLIAPLARATPSIDIGSMYEYMSMSKQFLVKPVWNRGSSTAYIKVTPVEIFFDEGGKEYTSNDKADGDAIKKKDGLLASPSHLIVPAKGRATVRLVHIGKREQERYYRIGFNPVVPQTQDEFKLDEAAAEQYQQSFKAGVTVLAGYGAILIVRPLSTHFDTRIEQRDGQHIIRNNGNSTVLLQYFKACREQQCSGEQLIHLRPGQSKLVPKDGQHYRFTLKEGEQSRPFDLH